MQETAGSGITAMRLITPEEMHRAEKLSAEACRGHIEAFIRLPNASNYDNLSLALRELQSAWMIGRKRVME